MISKCLVSYFWKAKCAIDQEAAVNGHFALREAASFTSCTDGVMHLSYALHGIPRAVVGRFVVGIIPEGLVHQD